jgi:hypothetical protein
MLRRSRYRLHRYDRRAVPPTPSTYAVGVSSSTKQWTAQLLRHDRSAWPSILDTNSGLPGPRANTSLAIALAAVADPDLIDQLLASDDEYQMMCGALCLGTLVADDGVRARLRSLALDERWRVREGVVIGMQEAGDTDLAAVQSVVLDWAGDADPLIARAAAATICEPRLLRSAEAAAVAIEVCRRATAVLTALPSASRRSAAARTLRQSLGYCWSVAVAADPRPGLAAFGTLDTTDPDLEWITRTNRSKKRLAHLL